MKVLAKITNVFPPQEVNTQSQGAAQKPLKKQSLIISTGLSQYLVEAFGDTVEVLKSLNINEPEKWSNFYEINLEFTVREYKKEGETQSRFFQQIRLKDIAEAIVFG